MKIVNEKLINITIPVILSMIVFLSLTTWFNFTLSTDDYGYMASVESDQGFPLTHTSPYFSRVPLWYVINWANFSTFPWSSSFIGMYFFFFIHAISFSLILYFLTKKIDLSPPVTAYVFLVTTFILYPLHYEILYWPTCMPYVFGLLFLAFSLYIKNTFGKIFLLTLSFATSEMFIVPALFLLLLPHIFKADHIHEFITVAKKLVILWLSALATAFLIQCFIAYVFADFYPFPVTLSLHIIGFNILFSIQQLFSISFYTVHIRPTIVYLLVVGAIVLLVRRKLPIPILLILIITIVFSSVAQWPLRYTAQRSLYGAHIYTTVVIALLLLLSYSKYLHRKIIFYVLTVILLLLFLNHSRAIFSIKNYNYELLKKQENILLKKMIECTEPCHLELIDLDRGIITDWVLYRDYWVGFAKWVKEKNDLQKEITFFVDR